MRALTDVSGLTFVHAESNQLVESAQAEAARCVLSTVPDPTQSLPHVASVACPDGRDGSDVSAEMAPLRWHRWDAT